MTCRGHTGVFVYVTDAECSDPPPQHNAGPIMLMIDNSKRPEFFTPYGALRRRYIEQLAQERPTKRIMRRG